MGTAIMWYVIMGETQLDRFIPDSKAQSAEWTGIGHPCSNWSKAQIWAGEVMASIFWDRQGILFMDEFENGAIHQ